MINSKVKFYFYKKRQWKQYKTHWKDITEWASSGAWPWKGWIQREGKAVLFLGCTGSCSEEGAAGYKAEATNADPTKCKPCGEWQWWPTVLRSGGSLAHLSRAWWWRSLRFQKNILAFALPGITSRSSTTAAGRAADWREFITQVRGTLCWQTLPPRTPQTWYCRVLYKDSLTTGSEHGVCPLSLLLWKHFAKILCKSSFPLHKHSFGGGWYCFIIFCKYIT